MWNLFGMAMLFGILVLPAHAADPAGEKASPAAQVDGRPVQLARYAKAFVGTGNITVEVAPYKRGIKEGAILLFKGVEGEWDGQAINHEVRPAPYDGVKYVTQYEGQDWTTLVTRKNNKGEFQYELYVPGVQGGVSLAPSDGAAQLTDPKKIVQEYQRQKSQPQ